MKMSFSLSCLDSPSIFSARTPRQFLKILFKVFYICIFYIPIVHYLQINSISVGFCQHTCSTESRKNIINPLNLPNQNYIYQLTIVFWQIHSTPLSLCLLCFLLSIANKTTKIINIASVQYIVILYDKRAGFRMSYIFQVINYFSLACRILFSQMLLIKHLASQHMSMYSDS